MKKLIFIIALVLIGSTSFSQVNLASKIPLDPNVKTGVLPNGMTYYVMYNKKPEHRAEFRLAVNVGSTQENDNQQGLAHFTEHMAFNGTKNFKKNELVDYIESMGIKFGADLNAYTSFDETVYMLQIPTDSVHIIDKAFQIFEDWAHNLLFDSVEIDKERGVVTEEWRLGQGANERMRRQYWPTMFKDSRYAERLPIGKKEILHDCKYETLRSFYREWYRPENMAIMVIGDIDVDKTIDRIKKQFGVIPQKANAKPVQSFPVPDTKGVIIATAKDKEATNTIIEMFYKLPKEAAKTQADYRNDLIAEVYNSMLNNRLTELQQLANPPFVYGSTSYGGLVRTKNAYTSFALVKDGGIEKGLEALVTENQRVKKFGYNQSELDRVKKSMLRGKEKQYNERDKTESRNFTYGMVANFLEKEPYPGIAFEYEFYKSQMPGVTLEEVNALAKKWINEENPVIVITSPDKPEATIPSDDKIKAILKNVLSADIKPYIDKVIDKPLLAVKPPTGRVVDEKLNKELNITTWKLSNGTTVLLKPTDFKNDEISFAGFSFGGSSLYTEKDYINASQCATIIDNGGLGEFNSVDLQKLLSGKVANVSPYVSSTTQGFNGSCSPQDAETMMQMLYLYFTNPGKDKTDFLAYIEKQKGFLQNRSSSPEAAFQDTIGATMGQYHYTAMPMTIDKLKQIDFDRVLQIYKERFSDPSGFTFTFVGNFKPETFKPLIEMYIGGIPALNKKETYKNLGVVPPKGMVEKTVKKGVEPKSSVNIKLTGAFEYTRQNRNNLNMLMSLVSIKLREQMREEKGGVYGVGAYPQMFHYPDQRYEINFRWGCAPENVDMLVKTMWEEIEKIKANGCDDKDLQKIKETAIRERETNLKDNRFWLNTINSNAINGEDIMEVLAYTDYVNGLKSETLKRFAGMYLNKQNVAKFVLNPEK